MIDGTMIAEFILRNSDKIYSLTKQAYSYVDDSIKLKIKDQYSNYLTNTKEKYEKSKSFFIRNEPVKLYSYYVPTGIRCGKKEIKTPNFKTCNEYSNRVILLGTGGSGKSILMRHLFLDCIVNATYVPIMIELRDINSKAVSLEQFILDTLSIYGLDVSNEYLKKAQEQGHFCFFIDGYDEVDYSVRNDMLKQIKKLSERFKECPIILSSRPDEVLIGLDEFSIFQIEPLTLEAASLLVSKLPFDDGIKSKFIENLKASLFSKHTSFLSNPLLLSIMLLTYGENAEIPSKISLFYNQAYEALYQRHDANKGGYKRKRKTDLDIQDFSKVFSLFSLQSYDKRTFKMSKTDCLTFISKSQKSLSLKFEPEDYLSDLLSAVCLLIEDGLEIAYSHRSFQEYFVALKIANSTPEIQKSLIDRYWHNIISDNVISLLLEINPDVVERELFIPKLEDVLNKAGVKRKVGVTHTFKYLKYMYSEFNLEPDDLTATMRHDTLSLSRVIKKAVSHCDTYHQPEIIDGKSIASIIYENHSSTGVTHITINGASYKHAVINEIINSAGIFSLSYLNAVLDAYKRLKFKHINAKKSLNELLGI
ncbi:NACHT domain-containing protein [Aeromonas hydrophila]|uniref:NACHT domain-containing protein n=1 Tax=Aeromonas hydrophila TaxID=644 RepID=UPI003D20909D